MQGDFFLAMPVFVHVDTSSLLLQMGHCQCLHTIGMADLRNFRQEVIFCMYFPSENHSVFLLSHLHRFLKKPKS